jgi:membrane carboxypeptidase/penicillin-binding protein
MVGAYAMFDNGGKKVQPTLIDRIQDRYGRTIYRTTRANAAAATPTNGRTRASRRWSTSATACSTR